MRVHTGVMHAAGDGSSHDSGTGFLAAPTPEAASLPAPLSASLPASASEPVSQPVSLPVMNP
ncbi:MAG: hypothetical protein OXE79_06470 [Acidimicrobiaceae bacterium]|nr:hypothetical protein [Acidimicrobiaceae bacterium]MCY4174819.1 hypothetical protein [Acidimicrobiaceae bacterium]